MLAHAGVIGAAGATTGAPAGWTNSDIGDNSIAGSVIYSSGAFTVEAAGRDIWGEDDSFHYIYWSLNGDGTIVARVASMTGADGWEKAGVMIRESLYDGSSNATALVSAGNGVKFQSRVTTYASSSTEAGDSSTPPHWVKLARSSNTFTAYQSANGTTWTQIGSSVTISMATSVYIGLAMSSHNLSSVSTAVFDNVSIL